jgi:hypothetical protein
LPMPPQQRIRRHDVAISRNVRRPTWNARTASRGRWSSVNRNRRLPNCRRRSRFSSIRYAIAPRSRRSSQPVSTNSTIRSAEGSITGPSLHHGRAQTTSTQLWNRKRPCRYDQRKRDDTPSGGRIDRYHLNSSSLTDAPIS